MTTAPGGAFSGFRWRSIGPFRGGRVVAVAADPTDPNVHYFGSTGGGVWKTVDGGVLWRNVSDGYFHRASVGALAVAHSDPNVIYAGMGESCIRGNVKAGDGVYRSTDAGATWTHVGLALTRHIGKIRIDPRDPETAYVAALGDIHGPSAARGVFRTRDGGATWVRVLQRGDRTGAIDLSIDTRNHRVVFAATWDAERQPWIVSSGGPGSGLFRSNDGGDTWTDLSRAAGLPRGMLGRIGVAVSPARSGRVYALVEAQDGGLYRSDDHGDHWERLAVDRPLWYRGYYYTHVIADPQDPETLYVMNQDCWRSLDGGRTFSKVPTPHMDTHDLWIDPADSRRMILGCDGGAAVTRTGGHLWSSIYNQPTAELYRVTTDSRTPYRLYASQQDCGTITVPSRSMQGAIVHADAYDVGGGEAGWIAVRADEPDVVFAADYNGLLTRYDHRTGQARNIEVWPEQTAWGLGASEVRHRFGWSTPVLLSPHDPGVLYVAGERVFRSNDEGATWAPVSPDLTLADVARLEPSGAPISAAAPSTERERVATILTLAESTLVRGLLWAGSDDGLVHVTRNGGARWDSVTPRALAPWSAVSCIEPSPHDPAVAYLAASRDLLGDQRPLVFRTGDHGRTWRPIAGGLPGDVVTHVIREDPVRRGLLYLGTETGVHVSFDDGDTWGPLQGELPVVPVHDLTLKEGDLVAATHGRGFWILDDITALRDPRFARPSRVPRLFAPREYVRFQSGPRYAMPAAPGFVNYRGEGTNTILWEPRAGSGERLLEAGENPPNGVTVRYALPRGGETIGLVFLDDAGSEINRFESTGAHPRPLAEQGLSRFVWDTRYPGFTPLDGASTGRPDRGLAGPLAPPGRYRVRLEVGAWTRTVAFSIAADPRLTASAADHQTRFTLLIRIRDLLSESHRAVNEVRALRARLTVSGGRPPRVLLATLDRIEGALVQTSSTSAFISAPGLVAKLSGLASRVASADAAPTRASTQVFVLLERDLRRHLAALRRAALAG